MPRTGFIFTSLIQRGEAEIAAAAESTTRSFAAQTAVAADQPRQRGIFGEVNRIAEAEVRNDRLSELGLTDSGNLSAGHLGNRGGVGIQAFSPSERFELQLTSGQRVEAYCLRHQHDHFIRVHVGYRVIDLSPDCEVLAQWGWVPASELTSSNRIAVLCGTQKPVTSAAGVALTEPMKFAFRPIERLWWTQAGMRRDEDGSFLHVITPDPAGGKRIAAFVADGVVCRVFGEGELG